METLTPVEFSARLRAKLRRAYPDAGIKVRTKVSQRGYATTVITYDHTRMGLIAKEEALGEAYTFRGALDIEPEPYLEMWPR